MSHNYNTCIIYTVDPVEVLSPLYLFYTVVLQNFYNRIYDTVIRTIFKLIKIQECSSEVKK